MFMLLQKLLALIGLGRGLTPGQAGGTAVTNLTTLALLAPVFWWLVKHQESPALTFTMDPWFKIDLSWGEFALVTIICAGLIKLAHWLPSPRHTP